MFKCGKKCTMIGSKEVNAMVLVGILGVIVVILAGIALMMGNRWINRATEKANRVQGQTSTYTIGHTKYVRIDTPDEHE